MCSERNLAKEAMAAAAWKADTHTTINGYAKAIVQRTC